MKKKKKKEEFAEVYLKHKATTKCDTVTDPEFMMPWAEPRSLAKPLISHIQALK